MRSEIVVPLVTYSHPFGQVTGRPNQPPGNRIALVEHVCCPDQQYTGLSMINLNELPDLTSGPARRHPLGRSDSRPGPSMAARWEFDRLERAPSLSWDQLLCWLPRQDLTICCFRLANSFLYCFICLPQLALALPFSSSTCPSNWLI